MSKKIKTKTERLAEALASGKKLTTSQISNRFNIPNPSAAIWYVRHQLGYDVEFENRKYSLA